MRSDGTIKKASLSRRACWETQIMHNTTGKANSYFYYRWQCRIVMAVAGGDKLTRTGQKRQSSLSGFICTQVQLNSSSKTGVWRTGSLSSRSALSSLLHSSGSTFLLPVVTFNTLVADICSRQLLSLLISSSPQKMCPAPPPASSSGIMGLNTLSEKLAGSVHGGEVSQVFSPPIVWCSVSLLAGRGQQRSSGYLQPPVSWCTAPLCYIKSQIEMTWPVYLAGGMQCVRRPAVAGR